MSNKLIIGIVLLGFWLLIPLPFMLMGIGEYKIFTPNNYPFLQDIKNTSNDLSNIPLIGEILGLLLNIILGILKFFIVIFNMISIYADILFINFPLAQDNPIIQYIVWFLQFITTLVIFLLFRGN